MKFGEFPLQAAIGVTLAHSIALPERTLKKGQVLVGADLTALERAGIASVMGARIEPGELNEDEAAAAVAAFLAGPGCAPRAPYTGRCNLHSGVRGVVVLDEPAVRAVNGIDEAVTVATLPPWSVVRRGQVIASVKIIPFAVPQATIDTCRSAAGASAVRVAELRPQRAALILSELPGIGEKAFAATAEVTARRLAGLGSRLALELRCRHRPEAVADALRQAIAAGCELILIAGATVTKDRGDTVPTGIIQAGGTVERFGMPVEPGNMLLLARCGSIPVIGLPGCARSRRLNGLDWVLRRLLCGVGIDGADIAAMGVGGLIRSAPEDADDDSVDPLPQPAPPAGAPNIAALVLAAGRSTRMRGANKMLEAVGGIPLVVRAVNAALASRAASVTVVTGHAAEAVEALVAGPRVRSVRNPDFADGMSTSLRAGLAALPSDADGVIVLLADMPRVSAAHVDALIGKFEQQPGIVVPVCGDRRGNPILWPRRHFAAMLAITGDQGARELLVRHAAEVVAVATDDAVLGDIDTPESLVASRK